MSRVHSIVAALALAVSAAGCATVDPAPQNDPYEPTNRKIFAFDEGIDHTVVRPVAVFYNSAVPEFARDGVHNFLTNLNSPVVFGNDVLQGNVDHAGQTLLRAFVNSTIGVAGLVDVASKLGHPGHDEDFGETLAIWGAGEGYYLVLPLAGPSTPRDVIGMAGDVALDPFTYITFNNSTLFYLIRGGVSVLDLRARNVKNLDDIERTSVDLYATTRSLYRQHRAAEIRNGAPDIQNLPNL